MVRSLVESDLSTEEVLGTILEQPQLNKYWITPEGQMKDVKGRVHGIHTREHPEDFGLSQEVINNTREDRLLFKILGKGWVGVRESSKEVAISGTRKSIRRNFDQLMSDHPDRSYVVDELDPETNDIQHKQFSNLEEFAEEYG